MRQYLRWRVAGGTYFFTVVTEGRRRFLTTPLARRCLRSALRTVRHKRPFGIVAIILLPDHLHTVWELPPGDADYSTRWRQIKSAFSTTYLAAGGHESPLSPSRRRKKERAVWQRRFFEHTCRDEDDVKRCVDYLHWNPVKHGLVSQVCRWPWSSFHRYVRLGEYGEHWGGHNPTPAVQLGE